MPKLTVATGALVFRFVLTSATALAQNVQGPASPNFGVSSGLWSGDTPNGGANANSQRPLYDHAPRNYGGHAQPKVRHPHAP
jgi:hypothetical protein